MSETTNLGKFENDLKSLRDDVNYLKENMVDKDSIMTEKDYEALQKYRIEKKNGKLIDFDKLEKELGFKIDD